MQVGHFEVAQHLCDVLSAEFGDDLSVNDDSVIDQQIRHKLSDKFFAIVDWMTFLLREGNTLKCEFHAERVFVNFLIEAWTMCGVHSKATANDALGERFMRNGLVWYSHPCKSVESVV